MILSGTLPRELDDMVKRELEPGERILWMEQPVPRFFSAASTGIFLFGIPWTAFAIFWICGACGFKMPDFSKVGMELFFPLFGVPFVLIGLGMLSVPLMEYRSTRRSVYVITDRRAITFDGGRTRTIRSYLPDRLQNTYRKERRDGCGDVIFRQSHGLDSEGTRYSFEYGFMNIREPKTVEQMLEKLAAQATETRH